MAAPPALEDLTLRTGFALSLALAALSACNGSDETTDPTDTGTNGNGTGCSVTPGAWSAPDWDANTAEALALRAQLAALVDTMSAAEDGTAVVDSVDDLTGPYTAGDPSVADVVSPGFAPVIDDAFAEFVELAQVGPLDLIADDYSFTPGPHGGVSLAEGRGINEGGIEIRQIVDKGLFAGGAFYPYAVSLTEGDIQPATIEAIVAIWGADATLTENDALEDSANYSASMGFFTEIADHLTAAHAYAADAECAAERDEALVAAFRAWELSMMARYVHYAAAAERVFSAPSSPDDLEGALHELAEGLGLAMGFHGMADPASGPLAGAARTVTDAEVASILSPLGVNIGDLGASTVGAYIDDPTGYSAGLRASEQVLMTVYGLTEDQIAQFREPAEE